MSRRFEVECVASGTVCFVSFPSFKVSLRFQCDFEPLSDVRDQPARVAKHVRSSCAQSVLKGFEFECHVAELPLQPHNRGGQAQRPAATLICSHRCSLPHMIAVVRSGFLGWPADARNARISLWVASGRQVRRTGACGLCAALHRVDRKWKSGHRVCPGPRLKYPIVPQPIREIVRYVNALTCLATPVRRTVRSLTVHHCPQSR